MKIQTKVTAHPLSQGWAVECSECGPLSVASEAHVDHVCAVHMQYHAEQR